MCIDHHLTFKPKTLSIKNSKEIEPQQIQYRAHFLFHPLITIRGGDNHTYHNVMSNQQMLGPSGKVFGAVLMWALLMSAHMASMQTSWNRMCLNNAHEDVMHVVQCQITVCTVYRQWW